MPCRGVVVLVDDEEDSRELLRELLEQHGHVVATAEDGRSALDLLERTENVCLILLDLCMPRTEGRAQLARRVEHPKFGTPHVWIATAATEHVPKGVARLNKPFEMARLFAIVDAHCALHADR